jgi:hypothetical protein
MATSYGIGVVAGVVATTQGEAVCGGSISNYIARYVINFVCFLEIWGGEICSSSFWLKDFMSCTVHNKKKIIIKKIAATNTRL